MLHSLPLIFKRLLINLFDNYSIPSSLVSFILFNFIFYSDQQPTTCLLFSLIRIIPQFQKQHPIQFISDLNLSNLPVRGCIKKQHATGRKLWTLKGFIFVFLMSSNLIWQQNWLNSTNLDFINGFNKNKDVNHYVCRYTHTRMISNSLAIFLPFWQPLNFNHNVRESFSSTLFLCELVFHGWGTN